MQTITLQSHVSSDGKLRLEIPCNLGPGPVEVVVTINVTNGPVLGGGPPWDKLYGIDKELWQGVDAEKYLAEMREDSEIPR